VLDRVGERLAKDLALPGVQAAGRACGPAVGQRPQRGLGDLRDGEPVVMHVDECLGWVHHPVMPIASTRIVTLSRVMVSWPGTAATMIHAGWVHCCAGVVALVLGISWAVRANAGRSVLAWGFTGGYRAAL
jgi:hypothetical protein